MMYPPPIPASPGRNPHNSQHQWKNHHLPTGSGSNASGRAYPVESRLPPSIQQVPPPPHQYHSILNTSSSRRASSPIPVHRNPYHTTYIEQHERRYRYSYPPYFPSHRRQPSHTPVPHWVHGTYPYQHQPHQQLAMTSTSNLATPTTSTIGDSARGPVSLSNVSSSPAEEVSADDHVEVSREVLRNENHDYESTTNRDFVVVQPSFDDYDATHREPNSPSPVKGGDARSKQQHPLIGNRISEHLVQSRSPPHEPKLGQENRVEDVDEIRNPSSPVIVNEMSGPNGNERKRVRNLSALFYDATADVEDEEHDSEHNDKDVFQRKVAETEAFDQEEEIVATISSPSGSRKHRRLFSEDSMNIGHQRIDSFGLPPEQEQQQRKHHRVDSAGLDILSAVADATKAELAAAAGYEQHQIQPVEEPEQHLQTETSAPQWEVVVEGSEKVAQPYHSPPQPGSTHPCKPYPQPRPPGPPSYLPTTGHNDNPHMHPPNPRMGQGPPVMHSQVVVPAYDRHPPYGPAPPHLMNPHYTNHHQQYHPYDHRYHQPGLYPPRYYPANHHPPQRSHHHSHPPGLHHHLHGQQKASIPTPGPYQRGEIGLHPHSMPPPLPLLPSASHAIYHSYPNGGKVTPATVYPVDNDQKSVKLGSDANTRIASPPHGLDTDKSSWNNPDAKTKTGNSNDVGGCTSTNQASQTFVTAISIGQGEKTLTSTAHLKNASTNTDENIGSSKGTGSIPSHVRGGYHHRKLSSFSSVGLGTIFGSTILSPGAPDTPPTNGQHPLKKSSQPTTRDENSPHHRSASSVSFLNVLDSMVGQENDIFLRNLQESVPGYRSPVAIISAAKSKPSQQPHPESNDNDDSSSDDDNNNNDTKRRSSGSKLAEGGTSKRIRRKCTVPNCINRVVQGGLCIAHGAKRKVCNHPGCTKHVKKAGLCSSHGPARKRCATEGCQKVAVQGGRCIAHGARKKLCSEPDCRKQAILTGMCKKHHDLRKAKDSITDYNIFDSMRYTHEYCEEVAATGPPLLPLSEEAPQQAAEMGRQNGNFIKPRRQHQPRHTRGLSIFHDISADTVSSLLNDDTSRVPSTVSGSSGTNSSGNNVINNNNQQQQPPVHHGRARLQESNGSMW